ncbi:MAG: LLM class flavin-dependent oxidoreductase [Proteobacteria bacterium]|nr:LLM class flavin-dependent oxidoreductase [Pseudomonadota bacterium]NDD03758.1 LLM class flavin-dependent oxidoreductase [Pseudomonadota bacterium]
MFDLFHSLSDPWVNKNSLGPRRSIEYFLDQSSLAESLGVDTVWCAESHFSSETQKSTSVATIPEFKGEVGINCDSFQLFHLFLKHTQKANFGTAIHNIVGGSGGPIASAERLNFLHFVNQNMFEGKRMLRWGVAAGRFPYQNTPFQIVPRDQEESDFWPSLKRFVFLEALEIFLRLLVGERLSSAQLTSWELSRGEGSKPYSVKKRWEFESLSLVPQMVSTQGLDIVLGSHDPLALQLGLKFWDLSLFNLSFTSPQQIESLQQQMFKQSHESGRQWRRDRLPRTVMVFIDRDRAKAYALADRVLDTYVEAMKGTTQVPDKSILKERALVGDPLEIREQLKEGGAKGFNSDDRIMLWFEFNQLENSEIKSQMKLFFEEVVNRL